MNSRVLKIHDINPDGVVVVIPWNKFTVGVSGFVPCVNTEKAVQQLNKIAKDRGIELDIRVTIEENCLGVRFWRTL